MLRLLTTSVFLFIFSVVSANAQDGIEHGATGTLNHDYFTPSPNEQFARMKDSVDQAHLKPAMAFFAQGDLRRTQVDLEYVLARFINHPQALALAVRFAISTKNPTWAAPYFERALSIYPRYAVTHAQYGKYLTEIDRVDAGIAQLKKAIEINSKLVAGYVWLTEAYTKNGNADLAREAAEKARSLGYSGKPSE
jgi:Tfp pilus assembly protein PilF